MTMLCMDKKNLNWNVPEPIATAFSRLVVGHVGPKKMWLGAAAAILMYIEAGEERQKEYERRASSIFNAEDAKREVARAEKVSRQVGSGEDHNDDRPDLDLLDEDLPEVELRHAQRKRRKRKSG